MKFRLALALAALSLFIHPVHAQRNGGGGRGSSGSRTLLCRITVPISNTGNIGTNTYLAGSACQIPAGTLGANSQVIVTANFGRTSGTGNCSAAIWEASTAGSLGQFLTSGTASTQATQLTATITNANSLTSQTWTAVAVQDGAAHANAANTFAINTATTAFYVNASQQNTVSGDNCSLVSEIVELIK